MSVKVAKWIQQSALACGLIGALTMVGCQPAPTPVAFEPNHVFAYKLTLQYPALQGNEGPHQLEKPLQECFQILTEEFGTPESPKIPKVMAENEAISALIDIKRMEPAIWTGDEKKGLYRRHCVTCHGESGSGRGTTAASQNPYPRDFRHGEFKFKSTPRASKPTRADLRRDIAKGLPGSQMPAFDKLSDEEIEGLVDYVIYLSIRGQLERDLLNLAARQIDNGDYEEGKGPLFDADVVEEKLTQIATEWAKAESEVETFTPPDSFPVEGLSENPSPEKLQESIAKGKELFHGAIANCAKCHGDNGNGSAKQEVDYDDFTKEWTVQVELDPKNLKELYPILAMGALPPQATPPRNLTEGAFRGGREPIDIFRRIRYGINKTPMPSAALSNGKGGVGLTDEDLWHLVNYVRSLSTASR